MQAWRIVVMVWCSIMSAVLQGMNGRGGPSRTPAPLPTTVQVINQQPSHVHLYFGGPVHMEYTGTDRTVLCENGVEAASDGWLVTLLPRVMNRARGLGGLIWLYARAHALGLTVGGVFAAYVYSNYRLYALDQYLKSPQRWFRWKEEVALMGLVRLSPAALQAELTAHGSDTRGDVPFPGAIMREIREEITACERYIVLAGLVDSLNKVQQGVLAVGICLVPRHLLLLANTPTWTHRFQVGALFWVDVSLARECAVWRQRLLLLEELVRVTEEGC